MRESQGAIFGSRCVGGGRYEALEVGRLGALRRELLAVALGRRMLVVESVRMHRLPIRREEVHQPKRKEGALAQPRLE